MQSAKMVKDARHQLSTILGVTRLQTYRDGNTHTSRELAAAASRIGVAIKSAGTSIKITVLGNAASILRGGRQ